MTRSLVLWGASGQAKVVTEAAAAQDVPVVALFDNDPSRDSPLPGVPIFHGWNGFESWLATVDPRTHHFAVCIGGARGADRRDLGARMAGTGLTPWTVVHPRGYVATTATVGVGSQVLAMAVVAAAALVGDWCIVNTSASVDHDCVLADGVHIGPGAHVAGEVSIGPDVLVGAGATVLPRVKVGVGAIIGAGAVVTRDVPPGAVVAGNPARPFAQPSTSG